MDSKRQGEIALLLIKHKARRAHVRLDEDTRRKVENTAKAVGIPLEEALEFATEVIRDAVGNLFMAGVKEVESDASYAQNGHPEVSAFIAHVDTQRQDTKKDGKKYRPNKQDKEMREKLMLSVLNALGLSKGQIVERLEIDKVTWDRWRAMTSIPRRYQLEAILQLADQRSGPGDEF